MPVSLGGLDAGTTFDGVGIYTLLNQLLYQTVAPSVALSVSPGVSLREFGNTITDPLLQAVLVPGTEPIVSIEFKRNAISLQVDPVDVDYIDTHTVAVATTYSVEVSDGTTLVSDSKTYTFVFPFYYGVGAPGLSAAAIVGLSKIIETNGNKTASFAPTDQVYYFALPQSYGQLSSILDWNGFNITDDFTIRAENLTGLSGAAEPYYIYEFNNVVTHAAKQLVFNT